MQATVAVIDIGSNSIKSLAARRDAGGGLEVVQSATLDARISAGLGGAQPHLSEEGMARGVEAVRDLLAQLESVKPERLQLVATSAVRDAANGAGFAERIRAATGLELQILSGDREAALIGRGLTEDPALAHLRDFYVFDLGGGSLECLAFRARRPVQALSLPLGCVRLTERCVPDPTAPFSTPSRRLVESIVRDAMATGAFRFALPAGAPAIFTGGTVNTVRAIWAARAGQAFEQTPAEVSVEALESLLAELGRMPLAERRQTPGLPPPRADVFPVALATVLTIAAIGRFSAFQHSVHNLRYGLVAEMLGVA